MSQKTYTVGTIVRIKSGGPTMAVKSIHPGTYTCQWFAGKKLEQGVFPHESLEVVAEEAKDE